MVNNQNNQQEFGVKEIKDEELQKPTPRKRYIRMGLAIIIGIIVIFATIAFFRGWFSFSFSKDRVELRIDAPTEISSGEEVEFAIHYKNNNQVALNDVRLIIDYPQDAYDVEGNELTQEIFELDRILPEEEGVEDFKARLTGEEASIKSFTIRLNYQPENISSHFENFVSFKISISSVLIGIYLTVPQKAISGEEVSYSLDYINNSDQDFSDLKIELDYPSGFSFKTAEPQPASQPEKNNIWQLKELKKSERATIKISGILEGVEGENKALKASIGRIENDKFLKYSQASSTTQISASPLLISLSLNNETEETNVNLGEKLRYKIWFRNNTDIALSQLVLKVYLDGELFNPRTLNLGERGFFDSLNNVIIWSAAGVSSLALLPPGDSGEVIFSLGLFKSFLIEDFNDRNLKISVRAELETFNAPPQFNLERLKIEKILTSKVNSQAVLRAKGYYNETTSSINNFGPIPPRVNETTAYTIHWQVTNTFNDLENVQVTAVLPQGIEWRDVYTVNREGTELKYNERIKQIVWKINKIPAATGFLIPVYELVFQVVLRPSITQIGATPVLIDESSLEGTDAFTGEILESFSSAVATDLPDDLSVDRGEGRVAE